MYIKKTVHIVVVLLVMVIATAGLNLTNRTLYAAGFSDDHSDPVHPAFPKEVLLIDVGHGGIDGGTSFQQIVEKDINLKIALKVFMLLKSKGYYAILNRSNDYALSDDNNWLRSSSRHLRDLAQRKELSRQIPTLLVISLHVNWGKSPAKRGPLVLHQNEGRSYLLADAIQQQLNRLYGTHQQPKLGKPFYILNYVKDPAVIVETGFLSNPQDRAMLTNPRQQLIIAESITAGIIGYLTEI
ncbi:N-acetylmuramoyl-L-alanine amidase [Paenibacillus sp. IHBB 10380]|uniref:N-acetylmuramoyl-L-alanine amidase n=1 Tax=Paenibacillus sp. IHBB 10380 TaxID=1566358 RepID=UPI0006977FD8|nr:N-acetylmuramoyl-L-alanine amidase [Paenibacillus sp. IHBB 10380]